MYIDKVPQNGYNAYLTAPDDDAGTGLDVGLLVLEPGQEHTFRLMEKELALLLLQGEALLGWEGGECLAKRADCFRAQPWCLHAPRRAWTRVKAASHTEIYVQAAVNPVDFPVKLYAPGDVLVQHAGANGELGGCMRREIKTLFDYDNAPYSAMVLGEVLNFPGRWSSYPPHYHPQPEVYFYRFDRPQGFGAGFANGEVYAIRHNGLLPITKGFHSQVAAPGYAMCYVWGIRHLPGDPWRKTRIDEPEHAWLWEADANEHIWKGDEQA